MQLKWRGVELRLIVGDDNRSAATVDLPLLKAVAREHRWFDEISTGKLSLVEPPVYQPFEPRARFRSFHLSSLCGPGSLAGISKIGLSRSTHMAPSEFETERNFIGRGPMGDIWLSLVRCAASNRRAHRGFRAFLRKISETVDSLAERVGFELTGDFVADQ